MTIHHPIRDLPINAYCGEREWQPIETAPCDGADVLCGAWVRGIWRTGVSIVSSAGIANNWDWLTPATHWQPLPAPPVIEQTGPANPECRNPEGCDRSHRMPSCRECSAAWLTLEPSERMRRRQEARAAA